VEGIFDYFTFYTLLKDQDKPLVVSTLGSYLTPAAANILKGLDIEQFIAAYDWDAAGRGSIERLAFKSGGWVYYLGGLAEGQDPYELLKPVAEAISGFSLKQRLVRGYPK
jgi:DNA primase